MTVEFGNFLISLATLCVLLAAAVAAIGQLRHIRATNESNAFSTAFALWYSPAVQHGLRFIQHELPAKIKDPDFRRELDCAGVVDHDHHPELNVLDFIDNIAIYVVLGNMRESMILQAGSQMIEHLWEELSPVIAIMRRQRSKQLYVSFEYLTWRAQLWNQRYPDGRVPQAFQRLPNPDVWRDVEAVQDHTGA